MPRPVDPERHRARRLQIIDAGLTVFARQGYAGATTSAICTVAGIGSGTFFHYFPTKKALILAILAEGATETLQFFTAQEHQDDAVAVLAGWVRHSLTDIADPRTPGFIAVVGGLVNDPEIGAALAKQDQLTRDGLTRWLDTAQTAGLVRTDYQPERLARWISLIVDGFTGQIVAENGFDLKTEQPLLVATLGSLLGADLGPAMSSMPAVIDSP